LGSIRSRLGPKVYPDANFFIYALEAVAPWARLAGEVLTIEAARLRSLSRIKLPDAIHAATALQKGCSSLLTNDDRLRIEGVDVVRWHELDASVFSE
jgi:predicted nucleic acid-binding protein